MNSREDTYLVDSDRAETLKALSLDLPSIKLNLRQLCDLELLINRAYAPLAGYMDGAAYHSVVRSMRLPGGELWPLPVCLDVSHAFAEQIACGQSIALRDPEGFMLGVMRVTSVFEPDKEHDARLIFGDRSFAEHSGAFHYARRMGPVFLGGPVEGIHLPQHYDFTGMRKTPFEWRRAFLERGWTRVLGFQSEMLLHRAEMDALVTTAQAHDANVFFQTVISQPRLGDVEHFTLVRCHQAFVRRFPQRRIAQGILPMSSLKAGPREALIQALIQKNFGCTHVCFSERCIDPMLCDNKTDPYYDAGEALSLLKKHESEIGVVTAPLETPQNPCSARFIFCEADVAANAQPSGVLDEEATYPEIIAELRKIHPPRSEQGFTLFLTGLSGAGKSTIAKILYVKLSEVNNRPITLLDGDIVRENLSSELSFSREHRILNVKRIGFVACEITKNRGIAICAPIAPYDESRRDVRAAIEKYGGFIEIYVKTPLEVCVRRDRKGLYAKARAGLIKGVTGIDDPYEAPQSPELAIDASEITPFEAVQRIMDYIIGKGYVAASK